MSTCTGIAANRFPPLHSTLLSLSSSYIHIIVALYVHLVGFWFSLIVPRFCQVPQNSPASSILGSLLSLVILTLNENCRYSWGRKTCRWDKSGPASKGCAGVKQHHRWWRHHSPHKFPHCNYRSIQRESFNSHIHAQYDYIYAIFIHVMINSWRHSTGAKPCTYPDCTFKTAHRGSLARHQQTKHIKIEQGIKDRLAHPPKKYFSCHGWRWLFLQGADHLDLTTPQYLLTSFGRDAIRRIDWRVINTFARPYYNEQSVISVWHQRYLANSSYTPSAKWKCTICFEIAFGNDYQHSLWPPHATWAIPEQYQ